MGLAQASFREEASAPLGLSEATAAQASCIQVFVVEASHPPAPVILPSPLCCLALLFLPQDLCFSHRAGDSGPFTHLSQVPLPADAAGGDNSSRRETEAGVRALNSEISIFLP